MGWQLILLWLAALVWLLFVEWCITNVDKLLGLPPPDQVPAGVMTVEVALTRIGGRFVIRIVQGLVLFGLLAWPYLRPFRLIVQSTFRDDAPPRPREGSFFRLGRRVLEAAFYFSNVMSLSAIRRFVYVALNPFFGRGWRPSFTDVGPNRIIRKLQIYIETEMLNPIRTDGPHPESKGEYGERIADEYVQNLKTLDAGTSPTLHCRRASTSSATTATASTSTSPRSTTWACRRGS